MPLKARDCMSIDIKSVKPDMNAKDALKALIESGFSGLPVIGHDGRLMGVFTEKEVLKAIMPSYVEDVGAFVYGKEAHAGTKKIAHLDRFLVKDIMRTEVSVAGEDSPLAEISRIMLTNSQRRVIVTKGDKAVGVITRRDLVKALAAEAGIKP